MALLKQILSRKKPYLEKVIEYTKFKGISPEQYSEMEAMFQQVPRLLNLCATVPLSLRSPHFHLLYEMVVDYIPQSPVSQRLIMQYDSDKSGSINARELRTCLYSLGEERSKADIATYMAELGSKGQLPFEPFRELMVRLLGDAGNQAALLESFAVLSRGAAVITAGTLADLLSAEDVKYISSSAPARDGGVDFAAWVADVCSR